MRLLQGHTSVPTSQRQLTLRVVVSTARIATTHVCVAQSKKSTSLSNRFESYRYAAYRVSVQISRSLLENRPVGAETRLEIRDRRTEDRACPILIAVILMQSVVGSRQNTKGSRSPIRLPVGAIAFIVLSRSCCRRY